MRTPDTEGEDGAFSHEARLYRDGEQLEHGIRRFAEDGFAAAEPTLLIIPSFRHDALRPIPGPPGAEVELEDMTAIGLNPARIISRLLDWTERHPSPVRLVSEPLWPGRGQAEVAEVLGHEALVESALAGTGAKLLCAYEVEAAPRAVIDDLACHHHRTWGTDGRRREPGGAAAPPRPVHAEPFGPPAEPFEELPVTDDLHRVRKQVEASDAVAALSRQRRSDFVLAVNEAATNALKYGDPPRAVRLWRSGSCVVGEVFGRSRLDDPLVGRRRPAPSALRGRGLWMMNQLCDLVELRSSSCRTTLRLHMRCGAGDQR